MILDQIKAKQEMKEHYVTLLNELFLPQLVSLHMSMERHVSNYVLWVICIDESTHAVLSKLSLQNLNLVSLKEFENDTLKALKNERTIGEYCWTLTPITAKIVFELDSSISRITYIDVDVWFRKNPDSIFNEFEASGKSVLITEHHYAPESDISHLSGIFCVQFITFLKSRSENIRSEWESQCIDWCYNRFEDGKFGDQKYLDEWPSKYNNEVHVLQNKEAILAPWNATRFPFSTSIIYHFHKLRIVNSNKVNIGNYRIPDATIEQIYKPYLSDLKKSIRLLERQGYHIKSQTGSYGFFHSIFRRVKRILRYVRPMISSESMQW